ncbi:hypothetical protein AZH51_11065 [Branchiibius sp. NY16-3462-2]|nr:hypothetical protein AZH51_11065 [Branchiibius sp. NY16-3462-2]
MALMCHEEPTGAVLYEVAQSSSASDQVLARWALATSGPHGKGMFAAATPDWLVEPARKVGLADGRRYTLIAGGDNTDVASAPLNFSLRDLQDLDVGGFLITSRDAEGTVAGSLADFEQAACS